MEIKELKMVRSSFEEGEDLYEYYKSFPDYQHKKEFLDGGWKLQMPGNSDKNVIAFEVLKVAFSAIRDSDSHFGTMMNNEVFRNSLVNDLVANQSNTNSGFILGLKETGLTKKDLNLKTSKGVNSFKFFKDLCHKSLNGIWDIPFIRVPTEVHVYLDRDGDNKDKNNKKVPVFALDYELLGDVITSFMQMLDKKNDSQKQNAILRLMEFTHNLVDNKASCVKMLKKSQLKVIVPIDFNFGKDGENKFLNLNLAQHLFYVSILNTDVYSIAKYLPQDLLHEKINHSGKDFLLTDLLLLSLGDFSYNSQESDTRENAFEREQNKKGLKKILVEDFEYTRFNETSSAALIKGVLNVVDNYKSGKSVDLNYVEEIINFHDISVLSKVARISKDIVPEIIMEKVIAYTLSQGDINENNIDTYEKNVEKSKNTSFKL